MCFEHLTKVHCDNIWTPAKNLTEQVLVLWLTLYSHSRSVALHGVDSVIGKTEKRVDPSHCRVGDKRQHTRPYVSIARGADIEHGIIHHVHVGTTSASTVRPCDVREGCGLGGAIDGYEVSNDHCHTLRIDNKIGRSCGWGLTTVLFSVVGRTPLHTHTHMWVLMLQDQFTTPCNSKKWKA